MDLKLPSIDVLILNAVQDEYDQIKYHIIPTASPNEWEEVRDKNGHPMILGRFRKPSDGSEISILVARCRGMGHDEAYTRAIELHHEFHYSCLAMCGVCAGYNKKLSSGDLFVATKTWRHGHGKVKVTYTGEQRREDREEEIETEDFPPTNWHEDAEDFSQKFILENDLVLRQRYPNVGANPYNFRVKVGTVLTVPDVTIDEFAFKRARLVKRSTIALEMESFGIALAAKRLGLRFTLFAKGVQDHACPALGESDKNDVFREFAAYSSALFVVNFLCNYLPGNSSVTGRSDGAALDTATSRNSNEQRQLDSNDLPRFGEWFYDAKNNHFIRVTNPNERIIITYDIDAPEVADDWVIKAFGKPGKQVTVFWYRNATLLDEVKFVAEMSGLVYLPKPSKQNGELRVQERHKVIGEIINQPSVGRDYNVYLYSAGLL